MRRSGIVRTAALAALVLTVCAASEAAVTVRATTSKAEVGVGEPFDVEVAATGPPGTTYTFPAEAGDEKVELRAKPADPAAPARPGVQAYAASAFAVGDVAVPAVAVTYRLPDGTAGEAASAPLALKIATILPKNEAERKLADVRPPVGVPLGRPFWAALGTGAVLLAGAVVLFLRRRRGTGRARAPEPEIAPDAELLEALERLAAAGLIGRGEFRAFYIALAEIAKRYLGRRLGAPVLEMTSAELAAFLRGNSLAADQLATVRDLTSAADEVKFARGTGHAEIAERHIAAVRGLVATIEDRLKPAVAAAEGGR